MSGTRTKFVDAEEILGKIEDGSNICVNGFLMTNAAEELFKILEDRFLKTGHPSGMHLFFTGSVGDGKDGGINHFAHEGMIVESFGAHYGVMRKMSPLIIENKIKAYNLPQGITIQLYRALAAHQPGILSQVGIGTFADPDLDGGRLNSIADKSFGKKVNIDGEDYIFYRVPTDHIDYCLIRGSEADENGNISMSREALKCDSLNIAMAAHNTGGKVIVQVERIVKNGTIDPKMVAIPRQLVDYVCVCKDPAHNHMHTQITTYNRTFHTNDGVPQKISYDVPMSARKVAARRAVLFLDKDDYVLNFGVGVGDTAAMVLGEEGKVPDFIMTAESGITGGAAQGGGDFGVASNPEALVDAVNQFDMYQGGMLDACFLGMAQCDQYGNINVSKFGNTLVTGSGGFIDITQPSKKVVFAGTFFAKAGKFSFENDQLNIIEEGSGNKFLKNVEQITFSGDFSRNHSSQKVYLTTERCVFKLAKDGWELIEIAPGIDLEKDILAHMDFRPIISKDLKLMDRKLFNENLMGLDFS